MLKLYYTPKSHFSRKVRILADALKIDLELIDVGNVAELSTEIFGSNPLMKVPTLIDHQRVVFDSDHIAQYLVQRFDSGDQFGVITSDVMTLNTRSVMNGVMSSEVELILAARTGIDTKAYSRYAKITGSITKGLEWLEAHVDVFPAPPSYLGFHLVAMWDHLVLYDCVPLEYPQLSDTVKRLSEFEYVLVSVPK